MNDAVLNKVFIFAVGAAIGSAVTFKLVKTHYEKLADEEINSMREYFRNRRNENPSEQNVEEPDEEVADEPTEESESHREEKPYKDLTTVHSELIKKEGYVNYSNVSSKKEEKEEVDDVEKPYVINPDEFGNCDYDELSLTYYADGALAYEDDTPLQDVAGVVGKDYAEHFGEYEDDAVYVRNDSLELDIEILRDLRKYSDVVKCEQHSMEDE